MFKDDRGTIEGFYFFGLPTEGWEVFLFLKL